MARQGAREARDGSTRPPQWRILFDPKNEGGSLVSMHFHVSGVKIKFPL
jgi:hypothetical protein